MKKTVFIISAFLFILTGCDLNELSQNAMKGKAITFSANTSYNNGVFTRTEYDGNLYGTGNNIERINWLNTDKIRIYSDVATVPASGANYSDYAITPSGNAEEVSSATASPVGGSGLVWGEGTHNFFGIYPSPSVNSFVSFTSPNVFGLKIPASQTYTLTSDGVTLKPDMDYAYMFATAQTDAEASVSLQFKPLFTAFEFTVDSGDEASMTLSSFELISNDDNTFLAGSFTAAVASNSYTVDVDALSASRTLSIDFGTEGITVTKGSPITFTLFALPQDLTGLSMKFNLLNGTSREVHLKKKPQGSEEYSYVTFTGGVKYRITNINLPVGEEWTYTLIHTGVTVTLSDSEGTAAQEIVRPYNTAGMTGNGFFDSYRVKRGSTEKVAVNISYEYEYASADANGEPVLNSDGTIAWSSTLPAGANAISIQGGQVSQTITADILDNTSITVTRTENVMIRHATKLKANGLNGFSQASPQDLSLYDISDLTSQRSSSKPVTANTYIVDRAGWYMFPVVYGNAIDYTKSSASLYLNGVNQYAYKDAESPEANTGYIWHNFQRYDGNLITSPYILDDVGLSVEDIDVVVVWQDVESADYSFITVDADLLNVSTANTFYDPVSGQYKTTMPYVSFQIPQGNISPDETLDASQRVTGIRQGNAVIAIRDKNNIDSETGKPTILWSWQIWVTDGFDTNFDGYGDGLTPVNVLTGSGAVKPSNDMMPLYLGRCDEGSLDYGDYVFYVRIRQSEGSADPIVFKVVQHISTNINYTGTAPTYQWGRKDPFVRSAGYTTNNSPIYSPAGYTVVSANNKIPHDFILPRNASLGITHPYKGYGSQGGGWINNGDEYDESAPYNLWNINQDARYQDKIVSKTVYDPCPPGYCLPHERGYSYFTTTGEMTYIGDLPSGQVRATDQNGDGIIDFDDYVYGWHFLTGHEDASIYFPISVTRGGGELILEKNGSMWAANYHGGLGFSYSYVSPRFGAGDGLHACAVVPVLE